LLKKVLPFQISIMTAVMSTISTTASRRAFTTRELELLAFLLAPTATGGKLPGNA
jgi:hypothetical protein